MTTEVSEIGLRNRASAETYRRLAAMDPPALRALVADLMRLSNESSALAAQRPSIEAEARAARDAQRAADAQAALAES
jgi:hypothetical protein